MRGDVMEHVYVSPQSDFGRCVDIAVYREIGDQLSVARVTDGGALEFVPETRGMVSQPTIRLTRSQAQQLLKGLLEQGIPSPSAGAIEGELKATKIHLDDMRRLLKIPKAIV